MIGKLLAAVVDLVLARVEARVSNAEIVDLIRHEVEQAIIQLRFAEMEITSEAIDLQRIVQRIEERAAFERGRANAFPDVTIVTDPEESE